MVEFAIVCNILTILFGGWALWLNLTNFAYPGIRSVSLGLAVLQVVLILLGISGLIMNIPKL